QTINIVIPLAALLIRTQTLRYLTGELSLHTLRKNLRFSDLVSSIDCDSTWVFAFGP
ncbi:unnamed protein product, partial [Brassica rapa subsp. narinosa]